MFVLWPESSCMKSLLDLIASFISLFAFSMGLFLREFETFPVLNLFKVVALLLCLLFDPLGERCPCNCCVASAVID